MTNPSLPSRNKEIPALWWSMLKAAWVVIVTGGSGFSAETDVTYATPIVAALLQDMYKHGWKRPNFDVAT